MALEKPPTSALTAIHPRHAQLIGEITAEFGRLDIYFGYLFAHIIQINPGLGHVIFHTPNEYFTRVELLENLMVSMFFKTSAPRKTYGALIKRFRNLVDKRHRLIHDIYGIDKETGKPVRRAAPFIKKHQKLPFPEHELEDLKHNIIQLTADVMRALPKEPPVPLTPTSSWPGKSPEPHPPD